MYLYILTFLFFIIMGIIVSPAHCVSDSSPPELDYQRKGTLYADAVYYEGRTELFWDEYVDASDSDGIDTVLMRYRYNGTDKWLNGTAWLLSGDEYDGTYVYNFTWPLPDSHILYLLDLKFFANDTFGNWNETHIAQLSYNYLGPPPTSISSTQGTPINDNHALYWGVIISIGAVLLVLMSVIILTKKHR